MGLLIEQEMTVPCSDEHCQCAEVYDTGEISACYRYADFMKALKDSGVGDE